MLLPGQLHISDETLLLLFKVELVKPLIVNLFYFQLYQAWLCRKHRTTVYHAVM